MIFKKFIRFILLLFCVGAVFAFSQDQELLDEQTEATASLGRDKLDFCCERDKTEESAHEMSEQEAEQIITKLLAPAGFPLPRPKALPGGGQR